MNCQHNSFGVRESRVETPIWFQPIVDTFGHRVLGHQCLVRHKGIQTDGQGQTLESAELRSLTIRSAASQAPRGLYFLSLVPSTIDDPELDMRSTNEAIADSRMQPGNIVLEVVESDLLRDPAHSHRIREYLKSMGFGFALSSSGVGAGTGSFQAITDFDPDYVNLDRRLIQNIEHPICAPTIGRLVRLAERSGTCVMADGVDRARTAENLWLLGVRFMQGHLFGDPANHVIHAATLEFAC